MEDSNMKKALLILALLFASARIHASHAGSELHIRMFDNSWFNVTIDRQFFNEPVTRFHMDQIDPGRRHITITKLGRKGYYGIGGDRHVVVFSGYVDIPAASEVRAMIDRAHRFRINRIEPLYAYHEPTFPSPGCHTPEPVVCAPAPVYHMDDHAFNGLMNTLRGMHFESSKMSVARNAIRSNRFTARQAADIVGVMTFDSSRLELAKLAYLSTVDKENFWVVYDLFTFESSIVELNEYISRV